MGAANGSGALQLDVAALLEVLTSLSIAALQQFWGPGQQLSKVRPNPVGIRLHDAPSCCLS